MKKTTLFLCLMMAHFFLFGQNLLDNTQVKWGNEMKFNKKMTLSEVAAADKTGYYLIKRKYAQEVRESQKLPHLEKYDQNLRYVKSVDLSKLDLPGKPSFVNLLHLNQQLWLFYATDPGKGGKEGLYRLAIDGNSLRPDGDSHFVMETGNKGDKSGFAGLGISLKSTDPQFYFHHVPNQDRLLIVHENGALKKQEKLVNLLVLDLEFNPIWIREETIHANSDELEVVNALLDSNDNAHLLSKSMPANIGVKALFKQEKYFFTLTSVTQNGKEALHKQIDLQENQINAANIQVNQDGALYFGGFYTNANRATKGTGGTYFLKINGKDHSLLSQQIEAFDASFLTRGLSEGKAKRKSKKLAQGKNPEDSYFFLDEIIIKNDGTVVFVGEDRQETTVSNTSASPNTGVVSTSVNHHYSYGSIVVAEFSPEGERNWAKKIVKNQKSTNDSGFYFSYSVSLINNNLYFIFNDNVKNLGYNGRGKVERFTPKSYKEHMMTFARLDGEGNVSRSSLSMNRNRNLMTITPVNTQTDEHEMVVYGQHKKKYRLARLDFDPKMLAAE
ncbi:hypothetical protein SAMN04488057_10455 [Cyclobacterium lianum]|uniref:Uncharacterized protein n=1 Tax=Cyclobacterium lianum TaxID=388280 RepID=A0A1M7M245_9BACT|nr:hypothetical protein [Cyclobacterium lianum]SHM84624.1 hypothetical protein SAMN04488057_10455 [Cyclobacterium lianum]